MTKYVSPVVYLAVFFAFCICGWYVVENHHANNLQDKCDLQAERIQTLESENNAWDHNTQVFAERVRMTVASSETVKKSESLQKIAEYERILFGW